MAFMGGEGVEFDDFDSDHNMPYTSILPNFGSSTRSIPRPPIEDRAVTAEIASTIHQVNSDAQLQPQSARTHYEVDNTALNLFSYFAIFNSILCLIVTVLVFFEPDAKTEAFMLVVGQVLAFLLRTVAVWQYYENTSIPARISNILFGSRFGWSERYDSKLLAKASVGVQFGFPLVLHTVSDIIQQGFSFYTLIFIVTQGTESQNINQATYSFGCISLAATILSMLVALLIRLSYGAGLIELSLLVVYGTIFLLFSLVSVSFNEFIEDKIYTKQLVFAWLKFFLVVVAAFTKTAVEVRSQTRIVFPTIMCSIVLCVTLIDIVATITVTVDASVFIEDDQSTLDDDVRVDQFIFANLGFDLYVGMFMAVQYMLLNRGEMY